MNLQDVILDAVKGHFGGIKENVREKANMPQGIPNF